MKINTSIMTAASAIAAIAMTLLLYGCKSTSSPDWLLLFEGERISAERDSLNYICKTNNGMLTIIKYIGSGGTVTIPEKINGLPVTSIAENSFDGCSSLSNLSIPKSVTIIGDGAFYNCTNLTKVMIGKNVISIGKWAFYNCLSLTTITVHARNPAFSSRDGVLFNKRQTMIIQYPATKAGIYSIPRSVTNIGFQAFQCCSRLVSLMIPNSVTNIGDWAFTGCSQLTNITIPNSVALIGSYAFYPCTNLNKITVDGKNPAYSSIDGVLFSKNQGTLIKCPEGKTGAYTIPSNVANIAWGSFRGCSHLTDIRIPDSVTHIGDVAFQGCSGLTNITIPDSVISIGYNSFQICTNLTSVTIGTNMVTIDGMAFDSCFRLASIYFKGNAPTVGLYVFSGANKVVVYYRPETTGWGKTFGGKHTAKWVR